MRIVVVGVDHTTAPIELRERLACSSQQVPQVLNATRPFTQECAILSTCNRTELYAVCDDADDNSGERAETDTTLLLQILSELRQVPPGDAESHAYSFENEAAVSHLCGVACGLYSLVPGEPQIQGQVAKALEVAQSASCVGPILSALFRAALVAGKRARSETAISRNAVSVSHVAVQLTRHLFPTLSEASVLLIGSGEVSELAARNLHDNGAQRLVIINRTHAHAVDLARELGATQRSFGELAQALVEADVVISSTTAPHTLITAELMQRVLQQRVDSRAGSSVRSAYPLLLIDLAMPRDIEPAVAALAGVHLYNLDDLQAEVSRGLQLRMQEIESVQAIIAREVDTYMRWLSSLSVVGTISDLRQHAEDLRQQELARVMRQLAPSLSEREAAAVHELTTRIINKLLHTPMLRLKDAAAVGQGHMYAEALRYLFDLEEKDAANYNRNTSQQAGYDSNSMDHRASAPAVAQP